MLPLDNRTRIARIKWDSKGTASLWRSRPGLVAVRRRRNPLFDFPVGENQLIVRQERRPWRRKNKRPPGSGDGAAFCFFCLPGEKNTLVV